MKRCAKGFLLSLCMFSALPLPTRTWDDACKDLALPCLPLVGGLVGAMWWAIAELLKLSGAHTALAAAALALFPFFATGFLHLDGYMDTSDAMLSRRPLEEKLRILKDPHVGAFAAIMLAALFTLQFAACWAVTEKGSHLALLVVVAVVSRCCCSISVLCLSAMPSSSYANMFKQGTGTAHKVFVAVLAVPTVAAACLYAGACGLAVALSAILGYAAAISWTVREFKGISGDLSGFAIVISEICGLTVLAAF
ncbi:MAG: adenosylcobinamide-GDP ribazoletransferase [Clostridiales bacterium]|nr:adenosylcobinamide-GDP ribazoletransferase [Clostridiales bacterium]